MTQRDFWRGLCTAIVIFGTVVTGCVLNIYLGVYVSAPIFRSSKLIRCLGRLILVLIAFVLLHDLLASVRDRLQRKQQLHIVKGELANTLNLRTHN